MTRRFVIPKAIFSPRAKQLVRTTKCDEVKISYVVSILTFFWIPAFAGMTMADEMVEENNEQLLATSTEIKPNTNTPASTDPQLKSALEFVYENHPALKAKREELKAIDEGVSQAISGFRPTVSANFSAGKLDTEYNYTPLNSYTPKSSSVTATQPIFNGGGTLASFYAAKDKMKAQRADLSALEQQTLYDAVVAYTDVVEKTAVLELNQKNTDVLKKQLIATKAKFDAGMLTITDVAQAESRLAAAQSSERQSLGDLAVTRAIFRRVIGYDAPSKVSLPPIPAGIPENIGQATEIARKNSPILESAKHAQKAAESNVFVNGATILPSVYLQGVMSDTKGISPTVTQQKSNSITLNLSVSLYQSGAEWSRLRAAKNQAEQAKFNTMDTNAAVVESVTQAWEDFNTASAIIAANESEVKATDTALKGVQKENEFGTRTVLDVLNAQAEAFTAKVSLIKASRAEKVLAYRLLATIGKLTSDELKLQTEVPSPKEHYNDVKYQLLGW